ncbi:hypothetical protein GQ457_07G022890 [Hibiscus cannabinus]
MSYPQHILSLPIQSPRTLPQAITNVQFVGAGKKTNLVILINEHEKYSFNPSEPGVLAPKPIPSFANMKIQETQGSISTFPLPRIFNVQRN